LRQYSNCQQYLFYKIKPILSNIQLFSKEKNYFIQSKTTQPAIAKVF